MIGTILALAILAQDPATVTCRARGTADKGFQLTCRGTAKLPDGAILRINLIRRMHHATWVDTSLRELLSDEKFFFKVELAGGAFEGTSPLKAPGLYQVQVVFDEKDQLNLEVSEQIGKKLQPFSISRALRLGTMSDLAARLPADLKTAEQLARDLEELVNAVNADLENKAARENADKASALKGRIARVRDTSLMTGALMVMLSLCDATYNSLAFEGKIKKDSKAPKADGGAPQGFDPASPMGNDQEALGPGGPSQTFTIDKVKITLTRLKDVISREIALTMVELVLSILEDPGQYASRDELVSDLSSLRDLHKTLVDTRGDYKGLIGDTMGATLDTLLGDAQKTGDISAAASEVRPKLEKIANDLRLPRRATDQNKK